MVICKGGEYPFSNSITDGTHGLLTDLPVEKGGKDAGFQPFTVLEAALAGCVNITLRAYAKNRGIKLQDVVVRVTINTGDPRKTYMTEEVQLVGDLTEKERKVLMMVAAQCPVKRVLEGELSFQVEEVGSEISMEPPQSRTEAHTA